MIEQTSEITLSDLIRICKEEFDLPERFAVYSLDEEGFLDPDVPVSHLRIVSGDSLMVIPLFDSERKE